MSVEVNDGRQRESCEMAEETDAAEGGATIPFAEELDLELKKNFVLYCNFEEYCIDRAFSGNCTKQDKCLHLWSVKKCTCIQ